MICGRREGFGIKWIETIVGLALISRFPSEGIFFFLLRSSTSHGSYIWCLLLWQYSLLKDRVTSTLRNFAGLRLWGGCRGNIGINLIHDEGVNIANITFEALQQLTFRIGQSFPLNLQTVSTT